MKTLSMSKKNAELHFKEWKRNNDVPHNYIVTTRWTSKLNPWDKVVIEHIEGVWICETIAYIPYQVIGTIYAAEGFQTQRDFMNELHKLYGSRSGFYTHDFAVHFLRRAL